MKREIVRLQKIELRNLKNVGYGCVKFATKNSVAADILGLYGQNGSGKTTLVNAIDVLKDLLMGKRLAQDLGNYIKIGESTAGATVEFSVTSSEDDLYKVIYEFVLVRKSVDDEEHIEENNDIDEEELKKPSVHVDMPVHADAADLLAVLDQCLDQVLEAEKDTLPDSLSEPGKKQVFTYGEGLKGMTWNETCAMWKKKYPVVQKKHWEQGEDKAANVYAAVQAISSRLKEGQITVVGNGSACVVGGHAQIIKKGQRFISNSAVASMGYDLPAAIGIWAASRKDGAYSMGAAREGEDVILITGDGSIQMNLQELQTIIHHKMGIKIFIINNGGYHSIRQTQKNFFGEPLVGVGYDSGDLSFPDMEKLSAAYGYPYVRAEHNGQLAEAVEKTLAMEGPVICEIIVSTDQNFEPKSSAKRLPDGTLVSPPLEDMAPFLPDEEMDENMIIPRIKG